MFTNLSVMQVVNPIMQQSKMMTVPTSYQDVVDEFFECCNAPKEGRTAARLIRLLSSWRNAIWIERNESSGYLELAYFKKELTDIIKSENVKLTSFERKLKEDLGLKVIQTTHGRRNVKRMSCPHISKSAKQNVSSTMWPVSSRPIHNSPSFNNHRSPSPESSCDSLDMEISRMAKNKSLEDFNFSFGHYQSPFSSPVQQPMRQLSAKEFQAISCLMELANTRVCDMEIN